MPDYERLRAAIEGLRALQAFDLDLQEKGRAILETVEAENRIALLVIGRPYHSDPGLNHGIPEEYQVMGYPILSVRSLPRGTWTTKVRSPGVLSYRSVTA